MPKSRIIGFGSHGPREMFQDWGVQWGEMGENNLGDSLFVPVFVIILYGIFGVLSIPRWLIKVPGHIPMFFG